MAQATQAALHARVDVDLRSAPGEARSATAGAADIRLSLHADLSSVEREWRAFEQAADCTVFQTFDWVSAWQRHIGAREGVNPVIIAGRGANGALLFLLPLAIEPGRLSRRLTWLGSDLCDYNAPLLAADFSGRFSPTQFKAVWADVLERLASHPDFRFDLVHFTKMPERVGAQANPLLALSTSLNPSGAYSAQLTESWDTFYAKRSSATRRRDRTKRKRLAEFGEVRFVTAGKPDDIARTLGVLMEQKAKSFAAMGVANLFARPGHREFYRDIAATLCGRGHAHVSSLDVGTTVAAANLGLMFGGRYYHLLASYDAGEVSRFGPGVAHLQELIRYSIEHRCTVFDFTIGDERYKREWCDTEHKLYDHVSVANARGVIDGALLVGRRRVKRWIKQTPALWNAFFKARAWLGSLRPRS
jgi:CelD/BcsL family acetyltransferase involved in cellulose biosynthesis